MHILIVELCVESFFFLIISTIIVSTLKCIILVFVQP